MLKVNQATSDRRIASVAMAAVDSKIEDATVRSSGSQAKLAAMEDAQQVAITLASMEECGARLNRENEKLARSGATAR